MDLRIDEVVALVGTLDPVVVVDTELFSDYVDMSKYQQVVAILQLGNVAAKTFDFACYQSILGGGVDKVTALKAATQLAAHAANNDGKQIMITVRQEDLASDCRYVRFGVKSEAAQDGPVAITVLAINPRYGMANQGNLTSVVEVKS